MDMRREWGVFLRHSFDQAAEQFACRCKVYKTGGYLYSSMVWLTT
jgi:hypothetical protein